MSELTLESLRQLAAEDKWSELAHALDRPDAADLLPAITQLFESLGAELSARDDLVRALHSFRIAVWAATTFELLAHDYEERKRRWWQGSQARWKFQSTHRAVLAAGGQALSLAGEPVTVEEHWRQGFPQLVNLAKQGNLLAADILLLRLDALHEDNDTSSLAAMGKLEDLGDSLAHTHIDAARWFYRMASQRFRLWISSASSGGEGLARSSEPDTAAIKLAALG